MLRKLVRKLDAEELLMLSKFFMDVARGVLGVPIIAHFIIGFSLLVLLAIFVLDLILVTIFITLAIILHREAKRKKHG